MNPLLTSRLTGMLLAPILAFSGAVSGSAPSAVASVSPSTTASSPPACVALSHNLMFGSRDQSTGGDVSALQAFLIGQGDLYARATGYFGILTERAVERFQSSQGIFTTGYVGVLTRAAIANADCGGNPPPSAGLYIRSVSPNLGPVGTSVTIYGGGFTQDNTIVFGSGAIAHVASYDGSTLTFAVPTSLGAYCVAGMACPMYAMLVTPGTYNVSVTNTNGSSDPVSFTVTGTPISPPGAPTITGMDAPATLAVGTTGVWTVHTAGASGSTTNLHYSVDWGDTAATPSSGTMSFQPASIQSSATFTHSYSRSGTFTAVFTVTDDSGNSATAKSTVSVTPLY